MKKYFLHNGSEQQGPFDTEGLKEKKINKDTLIWFEGLSEWAKAGDISDLALLFKATSMPPPLQQPSFVPPIKQPINQELNPKPKSKSSLIVIICVVIVFVLIGGVALMVVNNPNSIPEFKIEVNTPKPVVITTRSDNSKSGVLKLRTTVYATVQNQGGNGNVLVIFHLNQDGNNYDRTKSIYLMANESKDIDVTFEEVKMLGGDITYNVETRSE